MVWVIRTAFIKRNITAELNVGDENLGTSQKRIFHAIQGSIPVMRMLSRTIPRLEFWRMRIEIGSSKRVSSKIAHLRIIVVIVGIEQIPLVP